jgi:hypothetical protein
MWQTITIFISSTFNDMQVERDLINRFVVPSLNQRFNPFKIRVQLIDLRWGINTENIDEKVREQYILDVCLQEIDRSRPFFIGLLGNRYGWVPSEKRIGKFKKNVEKLRTGASVTELEIAYGAFKGNTINRTVFCFRNKMTGIPQEKLQQYSEMDSTKMNAILDLRNIVREHMNKSGRGNFIIDYDAIWQNGYLKPEESLIYKLTAAVSEMIQKEFSLSDSDCLRLRSTNQMLETILDEHCYNLTINTVSKDVLSINSIQVGSCFKVTGAPRSGKSVFLAQIALMLEEVNSGYIPIYYSTLADTNCRNPMTMLNYIGYRLSQVAGIDWEDITTDEETVTLFFGTKVKVNNSYAVLEKKIAGLCDTCKQSGRVPVFLIDSIDMLIGERYRNMLFFSNNSSIVIFACPSDVNTHCTSFYECRHCNDEIAIKIISGVLKSQSKELHHSVIDAIIKRASFHNGTYSVGWITLALYWIMNLSAKDYESIRNINTANEEGKIENYFIELINSLPENEESVFVDLAQKNSTFFGQELVSKVISALALSHFGIAERELAAIVGGSWDELKFAQLRHWLAPFISESISLGSWQLKSPSIRNLLKNAANKDFFKKMVDVLKSLPNDDPVRKQELPSYALAAEDYHLCASMQASYKDYDDVESFAIAFSELSINSRIQAGFKIINAADKKDKPAVATFIILMMFLRKNMIPINNIIGFTNNVMTSLNPYDYSDDEYSLNCISTICAEISLLSKNYGSTEETKTISDLLLSVGRVRFSLSKSFNSKQTLYKGLISMASYYMECGDYEKCSELYSEIAELGVTNV